MRDRASARKNFWWVAVLRGMQNGNADAAWNGSVSRRRVWQEDLQGQTQQAYDQRRPLCARALKRQPSNGIRDGNRLDLESVHGNRGSQLVKAGATVLGQRGGLVVAELETTGLAGVILRRPARVLMIGVFRRAVICGLGQ